MDRLLIDCTSGARKDSLVDAMLALMDEDRRAAFAEALEGIGIDGLEADFEEVDGACHLTLRIGGRTEHEAHSHHEHHSLSDVRSKIEGLRIPQNAMRDALGIYAILAAAEAKAHGTEIENVHFHEVGNDYAIASIVAFCMLVGGLSPKAIEATPITTGFGFVDCAHGRLPIPAPATANVLEGLSTVVGDVEGELTTPTGAAMVRYYAFNPSREETTCL